MTRTRVLLAGESWVSAATHYKGFDQFGSVTFHLGAEPLVEALRDSAFDLHYMPAHEAATAFPSTLEELAGYGAVILSDIGSNTLLLHPDVWMKGKTVPNRLKLLRELTPGTRASASGVWRFRELRDPSHGLLPIAVGAAATAGWVLGFAAVSLMLDIGARVSPLVIRDMIVTILLNALLALPVFAGVRKLLRPALAVDPLELRKRRRPPREAGPLGLRGLEV